MDNSERLNLVLKTIKNYFANLTYDDHMSAEVIIEYNKNKTKASNVHLYYPLSDNYEEEINYNLISNVTLSLSYTAYGASGGNCWGDDSEEYVAETPSKFNLDVVDQIISDLNISFPYLEMKSLITKCTKNKGHTNYEYYGNYSHYSYLDFDIVKFLKLIYETGSNDES